MATTHFGLIKDEVTDYYDVGRINMNMDTIDTALGNTAVFETAGGTATAITLTGISLQNGRSKTFVVSANNNGAATTINGKPLYKPGGTSAPKLIAGKAVSVWYDTGSGGRFFIKASAEGDAVAANVLAGKTFSNDDDTGLAGTMPNRGAITLTPGTTDQTITDGYHNGSGKVIGDPDLLPANIKAGINIFGVDGNSNVIDTSGGDATASQILSGKKAAVDGVMLTGTMANRGAVTHNLPANGSYIIPDGYHNGSGSVSQSLTNKSAQTYTPGTANQTIAAGQYLTGVQTILGDADLIPANIKSGINIFGTIGSLMEGKAFASGAVTSNSSSITAYMFGGASTLVYSISVSGLTFSDEPDYILAYNIDAPTQVWYGVIATRWGAGSGKRAFIFSGPSTGQGICYMLNPTLSPFGITSSSFTLPVPNGRAGQSFNWIAYSQ